MALPISPLDDLNVERRPDVRSFRLNQVECNDDVVDCMLRLSGAPESYVCLSYRLDS